jgi:hypothetical protein
MVPTLPGTLTNVTPEREVPTIPKATNIQLLFRFPMKKDSLSAFLEVYQATPNSKRKYPITNEKRRSGDIKRGWIEF